MIHTIINDTNIEHFENMLFMENHTLGVPVIMLGVVDGHIPVAAAAMEIDGDVGRIISIYVKEARRKQGVGKELTDKLITLAKGLDVKFLEADFVPEEEGVKELFESEAFTLFDGTCYNYIFLDELITSKRIKKIISAAKDAPKCTPFKDFAGRGKNLILHNMSIKPQDVDMSEISESLSAAVCDESGSPVGCVIASMEDQDVLIHYLRATDNDPRYLAALIDHLYSRLSSKGGCGLRVCYVEDTPAKTDYVLRIVGENTDLQTDVAIFHAVCEMA